MQPEPCLRLARSLWMELIGELHRRTERYHESGAFLLGRKTEDGRRALSLVYYDELDPNAYETSVCVLDAAAFTRLWDRCSELS